VQLLDTLRGTIDFQQAGNFSELSIGITIGTSVNTSSYVAAFGPRSTVIGRALSL
jgi:hypothetical protein